MPIVDVIGAEKTYANRTQALAPLDFTLEAGEFVSVLGPSGCGKSTLLKLLAGLLEPSRGHIRWWGQGREALGREGRRIGFVFQDPTLMPWARVRANVRLPLDLAGVARDEAERRVRTALGRVGLAAFAEARPHELSGGMRMRASIARALVGEPDLLLMDEPFAALDEFTRAALDEELLGWWRERARAPDARPLAVVFVTHSIHEALFLSERVVLMAARPGRIVDEHRVEAPGRRDDDFRVSQAFAQQARHLQRRLAAAHRPGDPAPAEAAP